jgi:hypothetical protein
MLLFCVSVTFLACDRDDLLTTDEDMGYFYFPLNIGDFKIYEVVDIRYTVQNDKDSSFYYLKDLVKDSSFNQAGEKIYHIYRYKRSTNTASWEEEPIYVHVVNRTKTNLVLYEESVPYVKLTFPVKSGLTWDGNAYNTQDPLYYSYSLEGFPSELKALETNQWIRVIQSDFDDQIVRRDIRHELYAIDIGLVYLEKSIVNYCQDINCLGEKEIASGREIRQRLISYGKE